MDAFKRVIYTESHDEDANGHARVPEEIWPGYADSWPSRKRAALGAALVLTAPGIPMLFQGQELVEGAWFSDEDPIDWCRRHRFAGLLRSIGTSSGCGATTLTPRAACAARTSRPITWTSPRASWPTTAGWRAVRVTTSLVAVNLSAEPRPDTRIGVPRAGPLAGALQHRRRPTMTPSSRASPAWTRRPTRSPGTAWSTASSWVLVRTPR